MFSKLVSTKYSITILLVSFEHSETLRTNRTMWKHIFSSGALGSTRPATHNTPRCIRSTCPHGRKKQTQAPLSASCCSKTSLTCSSISLQTPPRSLPLSSLTTAYIDHPSMAIPSISNHHNDGRSQRLETVDRLGTGTRYKPSPGTSKRTLLPRHVATSRKLLGLSRDLWMRYSTSSI
jgi:hypothetical protein